MDESLCQNCGRCCRLKSQEGELYRLTSRECQFLVRQWHGKTSCFVYPDRLSLRTVGGNNICVPIEKAIEYGDLPPDCPYALRVPGYKTKVIDWMVKTK